MFPMIDVSLSVSSAHWWKSCEFFKDSLQTVQKGQQNLCRSNFQLFHPRFLLHIHMLLTSRDNNKTFFTILERYHLHSPAAALPSSSCCCLLVSLLTFFWQNIAFRYPLSPAYAMQTRIGKKRKVSTASQTSTLSLELTTRMMTSQTYASTEVTAVMQKTRKLPILEHVRLVEPVDWFHV